MLSNDSKLLEAAFDMLNRVYFNGKLPPVVITIQSSPRAYGHFTLGKVWQDNKDSYHEINIAAEHLSRPIENVMSTLLHEMVHLHCSVNRIPETSQNGRYHNKCFKHEAEARDLHIEHVRYHGYTKTTPTARFVEVLKENGFYGSIERFRAGYIPIGGNSGGDGAGAGDNEGKDGKPAGSGKKKTSTRKYVCSCGVSVRATKDVNIICGDCMEAMRKVE
jgi:hypothetical protein